MTIGMLWHFIMYAQLHTYSISLELTVRISRIPHTRKLWVDKISYTVVIWPSITRDFQTWNQHLGVFRNSVTGVKTTVSGTEIPVPRRGPGTKPT